MLNRRPNKGWVLMAGVVTLRQRRETASAVAFVIYLLQLFKLLTGMATHFTKRTTDAGIVNPARWAFAGSASFGQGRDGAVEEAGGLFDRQELGVVPPVQGA